MGLKLWPIMPFHSPRLRSPSENQSATFRGLTADATGTLVVVARFLALLELYREGAVAFEQIDPLGELHVRWVESADAEAELARWAHETGEADEYDAVPEDGTPDRPEDQ